MKTPAPVVSLKWGDKITAAISKQGRGVFVATGIVHTVLPGKGAFFAQLKEDGKVVHNSYLNIDDEGTTWIKGHFEAGSTDAARLLEEAQVHYELAEAEKLSHK